MNPKDVLNNTYGVARQGYKFIIKLYHYDGEVRTYFADRYVYCDGSNTINYVTVTANLYGLYPKVIHGKIFLDKVECYEIIERME